MAWIRCCGGNASEGSFPFDLLQQSWDEPIAAYVSINGLSTKTIYMSGVTPKISGQIMRANCGPSNTSITMYYEVSTDGVTWTSVFSSTGGATTKSGSLSAYNGSKLHLRIRLVNSYNGTLQCRPINPDSPLFVIG